MSKGYIESTLKCSLMTEMKAKTSGYPIYVFKKTHHQKYINFPKSF